MKTFVIATCISILIGIFFLFWVFKKEHKYETQTIKIGDTEITLEVADTTEKRTKGLMYRNELDENSGMLFKFPNYTKHIFWMANTYIPLDIIWLDKDWKIIHIEENVPPCTETGKAQSFCKAYGPNLPAQYVIELNGNWFKSHGYNKNTQIIAP